MIAIVNAEFGRGDGATHPQPAAAAVPSLKGFDHAIRFLAAAALVAM